MIGLGNRVHTFARPQVKQALTEFFTQIFEAEVVPIPGTTMLAFRFPDHSSYSVDFTDDALDEKQISRSTWLEVITNDPDALQKKVIKAGLLQVEYLTGCFYFQAPNGQVWGINSTSKS